MKKIQAIDEIDCGDKTCESCDYYDRDGTFCVRFSVRLDQVNDYSWNSYRCEKCLKAEIK